MNNTLSSDNHAGTTVTAAELSARRSHLSGDTSRHWRDIFWLVYFLLHLVMVGYLLGVIGLDRFRKLDRQSGLTEDYWPIYCITAAIGTIIGWVWLLLLGSLSHQMIKVSVHILPVYLAVLSMLSFWGKHMFSGVFLAIGAGLLFTYIMSIIDRLPFTMLVLQRAVKMVWKLPEVLRLVCAFMLVTLIWLALWTFGASGVVAKNIGDGGLWWLLGGLSLSLAWTGAVLCNTVHVSVSGMSFLVLIHGGRFGVTMPRNPLLQNFWYAVTTSFGSICHGSLFTATICTLWLAIRGFRSKIGNECLLCCVDFLFIPLEILVRFFNRFAYVLIAVYGKDFNNSARDAWELFQSTDVEALISYDCSGAVLLMGTFMGGLITGTCAVFLMRIKHADGELMIGYTAILIGMVLVGLAMVVVESAVTSIYVCFAEDPLLIQRWDPELFSQMSQTLHKRLQVRSTSKGMIEQVSTC